ncbi:MAG TPA: VIT1/CCC1 transporter family protein [Candidatus Tyrphobacter sp.]|nr:VIT1/CCC1 transporter family protein [Candidatus Tyrphobacter sp.]
MNIPKHHEPHSKSNSFIHDVILGMADGITVPFAIAGGLALAAASTNLVITGGFVEIVAGSISMGLGGYLAAQNEADHYETERRREETEVEEKPEAEKEEVRDVLSSYGLSAKEGATLAEAMAKRKKSWIDFMMRFELGLEAPNKGMALKSAATIAAAYVVGGVIPLSPYLFISPTSLALRFSIFATLVSLIVFGYLRGKFAMRKPIRGLIQTVIVGSLAAGAAFVLARLIP